METAIITRRIPEMETPPLLRDSPEDLAMTGDLVHKVLVGNDRTVMPIEAVIPLIETAPALDSTKVSSAERLFTTLRRPTKHFRHIVPA
jgi:hypothetical protein